MKKRLLAIFLCICMCALMLPQGERSEGCFNINPI